VPDFPADFLWGASAAAHQVEGQNWNSDWWAWEHAPHTTAVEPSGDAIDFYHRYPEDLAQLAGLGHTAHRLSLEWARIEPEPGEWSAAALDHYRRVLEAVAEHDMTALATLHHFTLPRWLADRGGWTWRGSVDAFARYAERVHGALGDLVPYAGTINEPQIVAMFGHLLGHFPPGLRNAVIWRRVSERLQDAHDAAVGVWGEKAGICLQLPDLEPARPGDPACEVRCAEVRHEMEDRWLDAASGGWLGVQYYTRMRVDPAHPDGFAPAPEDAQLTQMGWELNPAGLGRALRAAARAGLPLIVTENGIATADDAERVAYLRDHLAEVARARADGVDVCGYVYWSAWDNFEWAEGYRPTFGLIGIDRADGLRRIVRSSAEAFGRVARTGSLAALEG
jgi:beta-glucosidase